MRRGLCVCALGQQTLQKAYLGPILQIHHLSGLLNFLFPAICPRILGLRGKSALDWKLNNRINQCFDELNLLQ